MDTKALEAAGFMETKYDELDGLSYTKHLKASDVPYIREFFIDHESVFEDSEVVIEVTPDGRVQRFIPDADHVAGPVLVESDEGISLLREAGLDDGPLMAFLTGNNYF